MAERNKRTAPCQSECFYDSPVWGNKSLQNDYKNKEKRKEQNFEKHMMYLVREGVGKETEGVSVTGDRWGKSHEGGSI